MTLTPSDFYPLCNLAANPFRSNPTQESDPRMDIWVGYEREKNQLSKYLVRSRADQVGNANFVLLYGDYGTGKSHALLWARYQILEAKKKDFNSVCYYIQTLRKDGKMSFATAFKEDIVGKSSIVMDVQHFKQFVEECVVEYKRDNNLGPNTTKEIVLEQILGSVELFNFAREIIRCDSESDFRNLLVPARLGDFQAMALLTKLINLFVFEFKLPSGNKRFRNGAYLFIDELDLLATSTAKEAREVNELIRHLYDNCPNSFCMALAFTATAAELNILFAEYVLSRVSKQVSMQLLDLDEAKQFVKDILDSARLDKLKNSGYYPFDEGAIQAIVSQIVSITPRKVINAMQQIVEEVRLCGFDPASGPVSADYLDDKDIIQDVLGS
jgi:hypothetical protein